MKKAKKNKIKYSLFLLFFDKKNVKLCKKPPSTQIEKTTKEKVFFAAFFGEKEEKFSSMLGKKRKVLSFFPTL
jgi:hypothetical protein